MHYDDRGDVLYLSVGEPQEAQAAFEAPEGHVIRYADSGEVVGITLVNTRWLVERDSSVDVPLPISAEQLASTPA